VENRRARVLGEFLIARMCVRVGRLQEKVPLKESPEGHMSCYSGRWR
jgi:hypothetical protein